MKSLSDQFIAAVQIPPRLCALGPQQRGWMIMKVHTKNRNKCDPQNEILTSVSDMIRQILVSVGNRSKIDQ
jgi:hypothetical protein